MTSTDSMSHWSVSVRTLNDYWNSARLRVEVAKASSLRLQSENLSWRAALEDILRVAYSRQTQPQFQEGSWSQVRWRTTPSAGALYPFEVIVSILGEGVYVWDVEKGRMTPYGVAPLRLEDLRAAGLVQQVGRRVEALVTVVARPWQTMKKYSIRGYAYCHLDVGHLVTNLSLYAAALGQDPVLHLRFAQDFMTEHLKLNGLCRQPLAVLTFGGRGSWPQSTEVGSSREDSGDQVTTLEPPAEAELRNWQTLRAPASGAWGVRPSGVPATSHLLHRAPDLKWRQPVELPQARSPPAGAGEWRGAILGRRSAKGFRRQPVSTAAIGELLAALRGAALTADCGMDGCPPLSIRLVASNIDGLAGVYAYDPDRHCLQIISHSTGDPRRACMQQRLAGDAAALFLVHAPVRQVFDNWGYTGFAETLVRAAEIGQRLHLAATKIDSLGITCIGGFDAEECANLAQLKNGEEVVYVILAGAPDDAAVKQDVLNAAYSHGLSAMGHDQ